MTNVEKVRLYAEKNPTMTVRQMASDLDLSPAYVHQIMWNLRKKGKLPPSKNPRSQQTNKIEVPKEWEEDAQAMQMEMKKTAGEWMQANAPKEAPELRASMREATALADQNVELKLKNTKLEIELARTQIIISYLEQRLYEEINGKGTGH